MKISQIALATIIPAAVAGVTLTAVVPFAQAAPVTTAAHVTPHHAASVRAASSRTDTRKRHAHKEARAHHAVQRAQAVTGASATASAQAGSTSTAASQPQQAGSDTYTTAGESSFEQCVAWRESSDTPTDPDGLFGILPYIWQSLGYSGSAGQAPVAVQQQAFSRLYAEYGAQPWAPSDGC